MTNSSKDLSPDDMRYIAYGAIILVQIALIYTLAHVLGLPMTWRLAAFVLGLVIICGGGDDLAYKVRDTFKGK
jgi:hypothetical protein